MLLNPVEMIDDFLYFKSPAGQRTEYDKNSGLLIYWFQDSR